MEKLYNVEELYTTGWVAIHKNLTRSEASTKIEELLREGVSPDLIRVSCSE